MPTHIDILKRAAELTDSVIVGFSRGKESIAILDLVCTSGLFKQVHAFHQHMIPGLRFIEEGLCYFERRYGITITRLPYYILESWYRNRSYQVSNAMANRVLRRQIRIGDIEAYMRKQTGCHWLCYGHKVCDSLERRGMLGGFEMGGVDTKGERFYPVAHWSHPTVRTYIKQRNIPLPPDYRMFGGRQNFQDIDPESLAALKVSYPDDYEKIVRLYPFVHAQDARMKFFGRGGRSGRRAKHVGDGNTGGDRPEGRPDEVRAVPDGGDAAVGPETVSV